MTATTRRWTPDDAWAWYRERPAPFGCNFLPSSAINATEMWRAATFDASGIDRELALAARCGFNSCRVFLPYLVWQEDARAFKDRLAAFLGIAAGHGLTTAPILFDDCAFAGKEPHLGAQDAPIPGLHNSGWTPSPGPAIADDVAAWPRLAAYVADLVSSFASDERIALWDLYNEPGNAGRGARSLPLLEHAFTWARAAAPAQPLTSGAWGCAETDGRCLELSDVVSFHTYEGVDALRRRLDDLAASGYPVICTEWMARTRGSLIETHLPVFAAARVGCYCWGLVNGRTQTHYPWGSTRGAAAPEVWFHDLFRADCAPYDEREIETLCRYSAAFAAPQRRAEGSAR